ADGGRGRPHPATASPRADDVRRRRVPGARDGGGEDVSEPIAVLYDVHGNLVALEAVLAEAEAAGATSFLLGGDYASFGPQPRETAERLEALPAVVRIRGNVDRWLLDEPEAPPAAKSFLTPALAAARESLGPELVARLHGLPERGELDGIVVCH